MDNSACEIVEIASRLVIDINHASSWVLRPQACYWSRVITPRPENPQSRQVLVEPCQRRASQIVPQRAMIEDAVAKMKPDNDQG